jgi:hypothetical protein
MLFLQIQNVEPGFLKQSMLLVMGLLAGAGAVMSIVSARNKRREVRMDPPLPQPLEVKPVSKYVTREDCVVSHGDFMRRLEGHDHEIEQLWTVLRRENTEIRQEMRKCFADIERSLGRIEGKLDRK